MRHMMCSGIRCGREIGISRVSRLLLIGIVLSAMSVAFAANPLDGVGHYGENIGAVAVDGTRGVFNEGTKIRVMDLTTPAAPVYKGAVDIGLIPISLCLRGNTAYAGCDFGTVYLIDISNPSSPVISGSVRNLSWPESVWVRSQNDYAYVGESTSAVDVIDVRNKTNPTVVRRLTANINSCVYNVMGDGQYLYAASGYETPTKIYIWSLSNPASPTYQGSCTIPDFCNHNESALVVSGNTAYIGTLGGTYIINLTNHSSPQVVGKLTTTYGDRLSINSSVLHVANWNTVKLWDISSNPISPTFLYSIESLPAYATTQIAAQGGYDYVAHQTALHVINTSTNPPYITTSRSITPSIGNADKIARKGSTLFLTTGPGFLSLDISNPTSPQPLQLVGNRWSIAVKVDGNFLYNQASDYLEVWNISNPQAMVLTDEVPLANGSGQLSVDGGLVSACSNGKVYLYETDGTGALTQKSVSTPPGNAQCVALKDAVLFVMGRDGNLRVYDVSDATSPTCHSTITLDPNCSKVLTGQLEVSGNNLHAILPSSGYYLLNIANRYNPVVVNSLRDSSMDSTGNIAVDGSKVYLTVGASFWNNAHGAGRQGIRVLDLSKLPQISQVGSANSVAYTFGGLVYNGYLYATTQRGCLRIYQAYPTTNLAPTQPTGHSVLAYSLSTPSTDPEGGNVSYTYRWTSDHGDVVVHGPTTATQDVLTEWNLVQTGETWTITATPNDGSQNGPAATAMVKILDAKNGVAQWVCYR